MCLDYFMSTFIIILSFHVFVFLLYAVVQLWNCITFKFHAADVAVELQTRNTMTCTVNEYYAQS